MISHNMWTEGERVSGFNAQEARSLRAYYFPPVINKTEIDTACERRPQAPNKPHAVVASMVCAAGAAVSFGTDRLASGILAAHLELCSSRGSKCPFCCLLYTSDAADE